MKAETTQPAGEESPSINERKIGVALSGGGHRACLFALGALLYLVDAGKHTKVTSIASVSGGSLANAAVAQSLDLTGASAADELPDVVARVAGQITSRGTVFAALSTKFYLMLLVTVSVLLFVGPWLLSIPADAQIAIFVFGVLAVTWLAGRRGRVCAHAFARTLLSAEDGANRLSKINGNLDHVFCATDLHAGEHVYFSRDFVRSYRFGSGVPGDVSLSEVVQASAAFPGAFPVAWLPTARHRFANGQAEAEGTTKMALVDGGVYDNMADQWAQDLSDHPPAPTATSRSVDELVVVSASAGLGWDSQRWLRIPLLGELLTLLRDKTVLYDNGNSLRRMGLIRRFRVAKREGTGLDGALVHIEQNPFKTPKAYAPGEDALGKRARAAIDALQKSGADSVVLEEQWERDAGDNATVKTNLTRVDASIAARLMHHAYVLAMVNLHVILGYPLLDVPDRGRFAELSEGRSVTVQKATSPGVERGLA